MKIYKMLVMIGIFGEVIFRSINSTCFSCSTIKYRGSPHKTVKWETENTVLCEIVLCETILELLPKTVLCETLLCTMRGIEIFQNQSYREISPM